MTKIQFGICNVSAILAFTFVGWLITFRTGDKIPDLVIALVNAYNISATQLPIKPSPAL